MVNFFTKNIQDIINHPMLSLSIIGNLFLIESILSIDNAAILSSIVMNLKKDHRNKALKYGIVGAYFFRVICIVFAYKIMKIWWLKLFGGLYLIFIGLDGLFFKKKRNLKTEKKSTSLLRSILYIEFIDLVFSIDNIFASLAVSDNYLLVLLGVFIGILSMRLIANLFLQIINKYPEMKKSIHYVIVLLGCKLIYSIFMKKTWIDHHNHDNNIFFTLLTILLFFIPIVISQIKYFFDKKN
ncbi:TerC family protein [Blattabacterium cuenoti]|uniref:TerC family protein n=1 Tax=Blattabacterium cuenoti TaxID=1653831 RepID=UPI00163C7F19|nr:DUF475 domain-containing protein [Blattabacterium cuenoti]